MMPPSAILKVVSVSGRHGLSNILATLSSPFPFLR